MYNQNFSKNLVKGRIAETLFEQMLREAGGFTVLAFGYENILPELAIRQDQVKAKEAMEIIRRAPDYVVIDNKTHEVHLVEVKYMAKMQKSYILPTAQRMYQSWKPSWLFISSPQGFYFNRVSDIIKNNGTISKLSHTRVSQVLQTKYTKLLNEFIS